MSASGPGAVVLGGRGGVLVALSAGGCGILSSAIGVGATAERFRFAIACKAGIGVEQFGFVRCFLETQYGKFEIRKRLCIRGGLRWLNVPEGTKESPSAKTSIALVQVDDGWPCLNRSAVPSISAQPLGSRQVARSTWSKPLASSIVVGVNPCHSTALEC